MSIRKLGYSLASLLLATFAITAWGQIQFQPGDELLEAEILDVNDTEREITVEFEDGDMVETYSVAEDAVFYTYDGVISRPQAFSDLAEGQIVDLEFGGIEGDVTLSKVTSREDKS